MKPPTPRLAELLIAGWRAVPCTLTAAQTCLWGTLFALPFPLLAGGLYRAFLLERAVLPGHTGLVLLGVAAVSLPLHEALHALGWKRAGRLGRGEVRLLLRGGLPRCVCGAVLPVRAYLAGLLFPFAVLGGGSLLFMVLCPATVTVLAALVNLTLPGADLLLACRLLKSDAVLVVDCPDQTGFIGLERVG